MQKNFDALLTKKVTRKEFIIFMITFLLTLSGVSGIFKNLESMTSKKASKGFGSGAYGA